MRYQGKKKPPLFPQTSAQTRNFSPPVYPFTGFVLLSCKLVKDFVFSVCFENAHKESDGVKFLRSFTVSGVKLWRF